MELSRNKNKLVLEFDSEEDAEMVQKALDLYNYKKLIRKSKGTEEDAIKLADEIKTEWWAANKTKYLK
jgi:tRNA threonylcarbamoyladenosine modification (KEOPS) complex  Pcc1 subunit